MNLFGMKKHRIRSLWLLLLLLTCSVTVWAQGSSVTGRVSDEKGELLIGVSVQAVSYTHLVSMFSWKSGEMQISFTRIPLYSVM